MRALPTSPTREDVKFESNQGDKAPPLLYFLLRKNSSISYTRPMETSRRQFLHYSAATLAAAAAGHAPRLHAVDTRESEARFKISLAQWSMHNSLRNNELDNLDFPKFTKENFDIHAIEWVNQFFATPHPELGLQPKEQSYLAEMKKRMDDLGMRNVLIMCDRVGDLGDPDAKKRTAAVEGHYAWLEAAKFFGCHSIRVNARSNAELAPEEQADLCIDGLRRLSEKAVEYDLGVIVENHGGLSSNGAWLSKVIKSVGLKNCGTLPDLGNFYIVRNREKAEQYEKQKAPYAGDPAYTEDEIGLAYDAYKGVTELMPFAKGVSAKTRDFDEQGEEKYVDYTRMMNIVKDAGYSGYIGLEFEGKSMSEVEGIRKSKELVERVIAKL